MKRERAERKGGEGVGQGRKGMVTNRGKGRPKSVKETGGKDGQESYTYGSYIS